MANRKTSKLKTYLAENFTEFNQEVDSERLVALYSDFSKLFVLNQYGYDTNVNFWRRVILDANQQGYLGCTDYSIAIEREEIAEKFQRPVIGKPLSLDCVIENMLNQEELISLEDFNQRFAPPSTWLGWIYNTVVKNAWQWRWKYDYNTTIKQNTHCIVLPTIKAICKAIVTHHFQNPSTDHILTLTQFKSIYASNFVNHLELTDNDISLILRYLHSQHGVSLAENVKGYGTSYMIIKFPSREGEIATITQHDEAVISIRTTCHALSVQVDELQKKSEELHNQSIEEKKLGHISKALYCLKRKKNLQQILERRLKSMETMDSVLLKIETSKDDLQVVQAFNLGADVLKDLLSSDGLTLESVDEAMEKIQNVFQDQKEIEDAIQMGNNEISEYNDQEIEDELSQLIKEEARVSSPPITNNNNQQSEAVNVNSELSRLNQMFSSVKSVPNTTNTNTNTKKEHSKVREYA